MLMVFSILLLDGMSNKQKSSFSDLLQDVNNGTVVSVMIQGQEIEYKTSENGKPIKVIGPKESDYLLQILAEKEIPHSYEVASSGHFCTISCPS